MTGSSTIEVSHLNTRLPSPTLPIVLRTTQPSDAARLAALLSDPGNTSDPNAAPLSATTASELIARQRLSASVPTVIDTAAAAAGRRVVVVAARYWFGGYGAITELVRDGKTIRAGDVGAVIDPAYRGKGYATEAMRLAIDWAFAEAARGGLQLDLVTVTTLEDSVAMVRLAEDKLGLKGRGTRRPCREGHAEGKMEVYYELIKEDWQEVAA
ncbi:hypothetical protein MY11210_004644 [Beauveria gryllotalpidicola]